MPARPLEPIIRSAAEGDAVAIAEIYALYTSGFEG
jgi:hypothetical protein